MNILYVVDSGSPGGVEQHVLDLINGMVAKGNNVFVWCLDGPIAAWYKTAGAQVTTKKILLDFDPFYVFSLTKFIKNNNIDVVHAHELKAGVNAMLAANFAGVKAKITHVHTPMSEWQIRNPIKKVLVKIETVFYAMFVNMFSDVEIALTESRKKIKMKEGVFKNKIYVTPNGIDAAKFIRNLAFRTEILAKHSIPQEALVIGLVGRMTEEKGHSILIEGFSKVLSDRPLYLLLAGGGKLEAEHRKMCKDLGIEKKVIITGVFDQMDFQKYYSSFDIFVHPTLAEGFGIVLIEAMSSALTVISSDLDVLKEVGGTDVVYFKTSDPEDLKNKIQGVLQLSEEQRQDIGIKLRERVIENFSLEKFTSNYLNLYRTLLEGNR